MNIIAAADKNMGIGLGSSLLFDIPEDKKFFKKMTVGKTVIMGRKTYESLPVKPLPERRNIILTRNRSAVFPGAESCCSLNELITLIKDTPKEDVFVIGGEEIYSFLLPMCSTAYITCIMETAPADRHIYDFENSSSWYCDHTSEMFYHNGTGYCFKTFRRYGTVSSE